MKIESIKKVNKDYVINISNQEIIVDENTLIKFNLYKGKEIDNLEEIRESIKFELELKKAKEYLKKPKTEYEVRCILTDYQDEIIKILKASYLINDEMYAYSYKVKMENKRIGKNNILSDLRDLKVDENILNKLEFDREIENIKYYIEHQNINKSSRVIKETLKAKLIAKGFNINDINSLIECLETNDDEQIKKDYEKALRKYNDLSNYELKRKVIKYLLQKGYSYELINSIISL